MFQEKVERETKAKQEMAEAEAKARNEEAKKVDENKVRKTNLDLFHGLIDKYLKNREF